VIKPPLWLELFASDSLSWSSSADGLLTSAVLSMVFHFADLLEPLVNVVHHSHHVDATQVAHSDHLRSCFSMLSLNPAADVATHKAVAALDASSLSHGHHDAAHAGTALAGPAAALSGVAARPHSVASVASSFLQGPESTALVSGSLHSSHASLRHSAADATSFLNIQGKLTELVQKTPPSVLVPLHAASIVFAVPGHLAFELGEGYMFGFKKGFALALVGKSLGAAISFGIGRSGVGFLGDIRDGLKKRLEEWPTAKAVAKAVDEGGAFSVFVIRVAPLPCVVKNYSLALMTDIPFATYIVATILGLTPTTAAHVFAGTVATSAMQLATGHAESSAQTLAIVSPLAAGALLTLGAGYYLHHYIIGVSEQEGNDGLKLTVKKLAMKS